MNQDSKLQRCILWLQWVNDITHRSAW